MVLDQDPFDIRCEWGVPGLSRLLPCCDVVIIVDVLSFSTSVTIATENGATIFPYPQNDADARIFAQSHGAILAAVNRDANEYSLSPTSLTNIAGGACLVLPSLNGAQLSLATGSTLTFAGCLRNASAVAAAAQKIGRRIGVIPAGERWNDGSPRFAIEDWIGAGAIVRSLQGARSPEAELAAAAFEHTKDALPTYLQSSVSGKELTERGFASDVELAAELNVSACAPILKQGAYVNSERV